MQQKNRVKIFKNLSKPFGNRFLLPNVIDTLIIDRRNNNRFITISELKDLAHKHCGFKYEQKALQQCINVIANMHEYGIDTSIKRVGPNRIPAITFRIILKADNR